MKLSQEFNRTKNRKLGDLSRLDDFLVDPLIQGHSGTAPETYRNSIVKNQATIVENSQSDPNPAANIIRNQKTLNLGPEDGHDRNVSVVTKDNITTRIGSGFDLTEVLK